MPSGQWLCPKCETQKARVHIREPLLVHIVTTVQGSKSKATGPKRTKRKRRGVAQPDYKKLKDEVSAMEKQAEAQAQWIKVTKFVRVVPFVPARSCARNLRIDPSPTMKTSRPFEPAPLKVSFTDPRHSVSWYLMVSHERFFRIADPGSITKVGALQTRLLDSRINCDFASSCSIRLTPR